MHCDVNLYVNEHVHGMKYYIYITAHTCIQVWQGLPLLARYMGGTERGAVECQNFYFATGKHTINNCSLTIIKVYQVHRTPTFENISTCTDKCVLTRFVLLVICRCLYRSSR